MPKRGDKLWYADFLIRDIDYVEVKYVYPRLERFDFDYHGKQCEFPFSAIGERLFTTPQEAGAQLKRSDCAEFDKRIVLKDDEVVGEDGRIYPAHALVRSKENCQLFRSGKCNSLGECPADCEDYRYSPALDKSEIEVAKSDTVCSGPYGTLHCGF